MRQVGRYLPEYRELRKKKGFMELCKSPELAAELTVLPVEKFGVDAAIIFSDILIPLEACGFEVRIGGKDDEVVVGKITSEKDLTKLRSCNSESTWFVYESVREAKQLLNHKTPIIGFAGSPFTLACYIIEGKITKNLAEVKHFMYNNEDLWSRVMEGLTSIILNHVVGQLSAGADVIQLFDTWAGALSPTDYNTYVLPYTRKLIASIKEKGCYVIYHATSSAGLLRLIRNTGADVIGLDWRVDIVDAWNILGYDVGVQGNLDPAKLLANKQRLVAEAGSILAKVGNRAGYIFNLGHGILPNTPVENVSLLVEYVHSHEVDAA
jgi:uroporphyrinogen decarboxylase